MWCHPDCPKPTNDFWCRRRLRPRGDRDWKAFRLSGQDPLAVRASKKLRNDELLVTTFAGTVLHMHLDRVPLWRGGHVAIKQLVEDFGRYLYLPRLADTKVLLDSIADGLGLLTWERETLVTRIASTKPRISTAV